MPNNKLSKNAYPKKTRLQWQDNDVATNLTYQYYAIIDYYYYVIIIIIRIFGKNPNKQKLYSWKN